MASETQKEKTESQTHHQPPNISPMNPVTHDAYGGGMYGSEPEQKTLSKPPASETQSADGPIGPDNKPKHTPPPSSGDRDIDITGQSYIQWCFCICVYRRPYFALLIKIFNQILYPVIKALSDL